MDVDQGLNVSTPDMENPQTTVTWGTRRAMAISSFVIMVALFVYGYYKASVSVLSPDSINFMEFLIQSSIVFFGGMIGAYLGLTTWATVSTHNTTVQAIASTTNVQAIADSTVASSVTTDH